MKKNKMLRMASVLLVLTMLTTSVIGGTFAKYVTTDSATDTARVAKFGVVATVSGGLFGSTYKAVADGNTITTYNVNGGTVSAAAKADNTASAEVVAPGTENGEGLTLSVTGTPEVSTKVTLGSAKNDAGTAEYANSDIYLAAGTYGMMVEYTGVRTKENIGNYFTYDDTGKKYSQATEAVVTDTTKKVYELRDRAEFKDAYYPLKWKVDSTEVTGGVTGVVTELKKTLKDGTTFTPNVPYALSAAVTWEWPFGDPTNNAQDTFLGDMIAADSSIAVVKIDTPDTYQAVQYADIPSGASTIKVAYTGSEPTALNSTNICACLTVAFNASLTVEQVD